MNHIIDFGYVDHHIRVRALLNQLRFIFPVQIPHVGFRLEDGRLVIRSDFQTDAREIVVLQEMPAAKRRNQIHELPLGKGLPMAQLTMPRMGGEQKTINDYWYNEYDVPTVIPGLTASQGMCDCRRTKCQTGGF
ncbi:hypothetical protein [Paraburkholderia xenovorans]|uniref:hypothetical protein n=1 Tax=Paraburkholderia xenovorans TaxID=36873 RepID=UPI0020A665A3|nr:hypothetical protein [Paraburkholderia xenovorans]